MAYDPRLRGVRVGSCEGPQQPAKAQSVLRRGPAALRVWCRLSRYLRCGAFGVRRSVPRHRANRSRARGRRLHGTRRRSSPNPGLPTGQQSRADSVPLAHGSIKMTDIPDLTDEQLERAIPARLRRRLMQGRFESGEDIAALRSFVGLSQAEFARAIAISVHTLRNWEQGRRKPEGPAIALLRIAARHPRIIRENLH